MNEERLNRYITQENLKLRTENSQLKHQMEAKDNMLSSKDGEILRLLNQIASDMVKRSDVDAMIAAAVKEAVEHADAEHERKMRAMAAEYEAKIASLQKKNQGKGERGGNVKGGGRKKSDTIICNTKEEALAILNEEHKKLLSMTDQAFGKGNEKLTSEQKPALDPLEADADDDSKVNPPIVLRGNYGQSDYEPIARAKEYCNYGEVDEKDTIERYYYPEGCNESSTIYGERIHEQWEVTRPKLYKILNHLYRCRVGNKKVWAQLPASVLGGQHTGVRYMANMILNKYLNGSAEYKTERTQQYQMGLEISRKTVNSQVNTVISRLRTLLEERYRWWILQDPYLAVDETVEDVFVTCDDGKRHLRTRYHWGLRTSLTNLVYFLYDKGSRSRKVITDFLRDFIGTIQSDGATMYKIFEKNPELGVTRLSCLVHIRRYLLKALKFEDETGIARRFLDKIQLIYKYINQYQKDKLTPEIIKEHYQTDILPILGDIWQELSYYATNATHECGELLMKAIHYAQAEWQGLVRFTTDGNYRPDNNYAEAIMRDLATGRKNFLFSGSDEAAKNLAFAYSLTQSCKLCKINPYDYWEDLLSNSMNSDREIDSFMPHLWRKA